MSLFSNSLTMKSLGVLEKGLNAATMRRQVLANNIANVDVPHFKRSEVVFESEMKRAMDDTASFEGEQNTFKLKKVHPNHISHRKYRKFHEVSPKVSIDYNSQMRNDGNNVDIEDEVSKLVRNQMQYSLMTDRVGGTFRLLHQLSRLA